MGPISFQDLLSPQEDSFAGLPDEPDCLTNEFMPDDFTPSPGDAGCWMFSDVYFNGDLNIPPPERHGCLDPDASGRDKVIGLRACNTNVREQGRKDGALRNTYRDIPCYTCGDRFSVGPLSTI